jgi:NAD(P)-dependent dehydrogenase (short-subunit alcohol dehydrogenase family)
MAQDLESTGVTVNVLVPGGPVNTGMVPADCGFLPEALIQPEQMCAPLRWLCTHEADGVTNLRIVAKKWDEDQPQASRLASASAPIAWPQLGLQSMFPT